MTLHTQPRLTKGVLSMPRRGARPTPELPISAKRTKKAAVPSPRNEQLNGRHRRHRPHRSVSTEVRPGDARQSRTSDGGHGAQPRPTKRQRAAHVVLASPLSLSPSPSPARTLLVKARQLAELDTELLGKRPFIMDVILNARPPVSEYSEDIIMRAIELSEAVLPKRRLGFDGVDCQGAPGDELNFPPADRYQVSAVRSTASWSDPEEDRDEEDSEESSSRLRAPSIPSSEFSSSSDPQIRPTMQYAMMDCPSVGDPRFAEF